MRYARTLPPLNVHRRVQERRSGRLHTGIIVNRKVSAYNGAFRYLVRHDRRTDGTGGDSDWYNRNELKEI